jgi:CheY-like chemotaxis protein
VSNPDEQIQTAPVIAIVNTNPDLVRLLRVSLEQIGFIVLVMHVEEIKIGDADIETFLRQHDPKVIVYDVAPPYDQNWRFLDHLRTSTAFRGRRFVLTTVNLARVEEIVGPDEAVHEVVGRSDDIGEVMRAVKEASRARATR